MVAKKLLIIGVDPGTTVGYAAIGFEGNIIKLGSEKNLDIGSLITEIIKLGKPLIVAGDKEHNPDFVDRLAIKLGARVIGPEYDLKVDEKRSWVRDFKTNNQHEVDALASAFFALKRIGPLLKKINIFVEHYKKEGIKEQLIEFVVGKEISIKDAVEIIEEPEEEAKIIKEVVEERKLEEKDFLVLYKKFKDAKKDIELLKKQNARLNEQIAAIKKDYEYMFRQISRTQLDRKMQTMLGFKEKRIKFFDSQLNRKQEEIKSMQDEVTTLLYFLSHLDSNVLLKKIDNLGIKEFERKNDILNISKGDVLLVKDPDIISENAINEIKGKVEVIFYRKPISKKVESELPFVFINANGVNIEEDDYFAILNKDEFLRLKNKKEMLSKIVEDYRKERG